MDNTWNSTDTDIFWGEIASCDHVVQIYENDAVFLDSLAGFVGGGIKTGECVIVIATKEHLQALESRLEDYSIRVDTLKEDDRYIPLDAEETLARFMVDGWPDETLFMETVAELIERGQCKSRKIRAFGEMVALLWAQGLNGATVHLEFLWNKFCSEHEFSLFCAYPKTGFTQNTSESIMSICGCHTKMIDGSHRHISETVYTNLPLKELT